MLPQGRWGCGEEARSVLRLAFKLLSARDLGSASLACALFADLAREITLQRRRDVSRGLEGTEVECRNDEAGGEKYPRRFEYTMRCVLPEGVEDLGATEASGCTCRECVAPECPCCVGGGPEADRNDHDGSLPPNVRPAESNMPFKECGKWCCCGKECPNRRTQAGLQGRLYLRRTPTKGWSVYARDPISKGAFICEYVGEVISTAEASRRLEQYDAQESMEGQALLIVRETWGSSGISLRTNIDATRIGNVGRFFNHSCDGGNLHVRMVRSSGSFVPRACFFAAVDILRDSELTFSYGPPRSLPQGGGSKQAKRCYCGTLECKGYLPAENV